MERKVNFTNQGFDIAVTQSSITAHHMPEIATYSINLARSSLTRLLAICITANAL